MTSARVAGPATSAGLLTSFVFLFLGAALAAAAPAAAIDDPTRPDARVTHGPSCKPGGLVVEVVAGTSPYAVRLATTRAPDGEAEAQLEPGDSVVLRSDDVAWGETIDGRLEFTARDGSGTAYVDELEEYSFTRPTREDCAAVARPTDPDPAPPTTASPSAGTTGTPGGGAESGAEPTSGSASPTSAPATQSHPSGSAAPAPADGSNAPPGRQVSPGEAVTVEVSGFLPGERVTIQLHEGGDVLGTATARPDGTVAAEFRIPDGAAPGRTTVDLVGARSAAVADVHLQVAGVERGVSPDDWLDVMPLAAAAVTLVGSVAGLVSVAGGQRAARRHVPMRSA